MAVTTTNRLAGPFIGNGTTTSFPFAFKVFTTADLYVVRVDAVGNAGVLILGTDYTVTLNGNQDSNPGGSVSLTAALANGYTMIVTSNIAELQPTVITNLGGFLPDVINSSLDRATILTQQLQLQVDKSIRFPLTDGAATAALPSAAARAGLILGFDSQGNAVPTTASAQGPPGPRGPAGPSFGPINIAYASELLEGVVGNPTATLNAFLATASQAAPVRLVMDIMCAVSGLVISPNGYTTIEGLGPKTGFTMIAGSNQDCIRVGAYNLTHPYSEGFIYFTGQVDPVRPARTATAITLRNFSCDFNGPNVGTSSFLHSGDAAPANQPITGAPKHPLYGIILASCTNVLVENLVLSNPPVYNLCLTNVNDVIVRGCSLASGTSLRDGVHIDGPSERIVISDCVFATGDDAIAINACEGWGGDISDVVVIGCKFNNACTVARLYASGPGLVTRVIRRVVFSDCVGSTFNACFNVGIESGNDASTPNQIESLTIANCTLTCTHSLPAGGDATLDGGGVFKTNTSIGNLFIRNFIWQSPTTAYTALAFFVSCANIDIEGFIIARDANGNAAAQFLGMGAGQTIKRLSIDKFSMVDGDATSYTPGNFILSPVLITECILGSISLTNFTQLINPATNWNGVAAMRGSGVLALGAQGMLLNDATVANGVPYYSAATSAPAIKIAGVRVPLGSVIQGTNPAEDIYNTAVGTDRSQLGAYADSSQSLVSLSFNRVIATGAIPDATKPYGYFQLGVEGGVSVLEIILQTGTGGAGSINAFKVLGNGTVQFNGKTLNFNTGGSVTWS